MAITLEEELIGLLRSRGKTLCAAESCTGGLIAKQLTDVPGASQVFCGGVVSYTNAVKERLLGVPHALLEAHGAVSAEVACAMAEGARMAAGADLAVSVTGVAGPDRDERGNPVGTVFLALAAADGTRTLVRAYGEKSRAEIRAAAADDALALVKEYLA